VAELETVAKELDSRSVGVASRAEKTLRDRSMAQVAVNWTVNRPGIASVIIGATKLAQLEDNLQAMEFEIPTELSQRLETISRPESQFPYSFFDYLR
jgi:aryl-alcohol dehydrogenase-like predicted oxidoreductase